MHCPNWKYEVCVVRAAQEYISSELGLDAYAKKYAEALSESYEAIPFEIIQQPAESILLFLAEIEANDTAHELLNNFCYFRLYNEKVGHPRKMKPLFGGIEDGVKINELVPDNVAKSFRAYVFGLRSQAVPVAPAGWRLEDDQHVPQLSELAARTLSMLDVL